LAAVIANLHQIAILVLRRKIRHQHIFFKHRKILSEK
jgi:hypothetical protein